MILEVDSSQSLQLRQTAISSPACETLSAEPSGACMDLGPKNSELEVV